MIEKSKVNGNKSGLNTLCILLSTVRKIPFLMSQLARERIIYELTGQQKD
ncbi:hypothetical protein FH603_4051 [Spirosoma sp. LMG 31447]|uniref:HTH hxlR-type domain-containing protein n=1 Tax=Spirosoma utsteinense TaxID=2585773 RepID=A0ABR6WAK3_9BACT|nr:hypothetical protein [Spirosoma utsteinense]